MLRNFCKPLPVHILTATCLIVNCCSLLLYLLSLLVPPKDQLLSIIDDALLITRYNV